MTDQELLEYAAKAVGLDSDGWEWDGYDFRELKVYGVPHCGYGPVTWNPLLSDEDAFRLAVKLALSVYPPQGADPAAVVEDWKWDIHITEVDEDGDYLTTTRRAIVRAAAEIGRNMTE